MSAPIDHRRRLGAARQARQRHRREVGRIVLPAEVDERRVESLLIAARIIDPDAPVERDQLVRGWQRFIDAVLHRPPVTRD